ncbi:transposase family protein [Streptomyces sp. NBC_00887]|uniref:helix-turn-helix domain-containing protein n=1 Tax=Streptomyces sp. NBC_00887 TaxID=2975859 RepID=UPI00386BB871
MIFVDRLLATLVHLRHGVTHDALACRFGVDRSTVTRPSARCGPCSRSGRHHQPRRVAANAS